MSKESKSYQKLEDKVKTLLWEYLKELRVATQEVHNALPSDKADKITDPLFTAIVDSEDTVVERITKELFKEITNVPSSTNYISSDIIKKSEDYLALMDEYISMEGDYERLSNEYDELEWAYNDLDATYDELKEQHDELDTLFEELEQEYEDLLSENNILESRINELDSELNFLKEQ